MHPNPLIAPPTKGCVTLVGFYFFYLLEVLASRYFHGIGHSHSHGHSQDAGKRQSESHGMKDLNNSKSDLLEQDADAEKQRMRVVGWMIIAGDALHNFVVSCGSSLQAHAHALVHNWILTPPACPLHNRTASRWVLPLPTAHRRASA